MNKGWRNVVYVLFLLLVSYTIWLMCMGAIHISDTSFADTLVPLPHNVTYLKDSNIILIDDAREFYNHYTLSREMEAMQWAVWVLTFGRAQLSYAPYVAFERLIRKSVDDQCAIPVISIGRSKFKDNSLEIKLTCNFNPYSHEGISQVDDDNSDQAKFYYKTSMPMDSFMLDEVEDASPERWYINHANERIGNAYMIFSKVMYAYAIIAFGIYCLLDWIVVVTVVMNNWRGIGLALLTLLVASDVWLVYMAIEHASDVPASIETLPPNITYVKESNIVIIDKARAFDNYYTSSSLHEVELAQWVIWVLTLGRAQLRYAPYAIFERMIQKSDERCVISVARSKVKETANSLTVQLDCDLQTCSFKDVIQMEDADSCQPIYSFSRTLPINSFLLDYGDASSNVWQHDPRATGNIYGILANLMYTRSLAYIIPYCMLYMRDYLHFNPE